MLTRSILPARPQIFRDAGGRGFGIGAAPAHHGPGQSAQGERHLGRLRHHDNAVQHQRVIDDERTFAREEQHRQAARRDDDFGARRDQWTNLFDEAGAHFRIARLVGEGAHEGRQVRLDRADADHALVEAMGLHLLRVPVDEDRVDGHQADAAPHGAGGKQARLAQPDHRDVERPPALQQARLLEMPDDDGVVACPLRFKRVADGLRGAAKLRERMDQMIGRIETLDLECVTGRRHRIQFGLQAVDIGGLLHRMDEALIP